MSLAPGTRIGAYVVQTPLGAGGMGEVYRARDTKLGRDVAIKILPDAFVHDADRIARFQREAQILASLNHPNIAHIYGLEDGPAEAGPYDSSVGAGFSRLSAALVMELVEGPTLADRIADGPLPLDEALPIARQIAEALEAAHEQGVIHRDLKPANVKVRGDGTVKVLDFGLAKLAEPAERRPDATASPTITSPALMTGVGMILGTAAYMAPEQACGKNVDKRADIWAFGCVLYEMLTGKRAFAADEVSDTLAMVLMKEPDWMRLPISTPPNLRVLLHRCLEKDRRRRLPDIGIVRLEIDDAQEVPMPTLLHTAHPGFVHAWLPWIAAAAAAAAAVGIGAIHFSEEAPPAPSSIRLPVAPPPGTLLGGGGSAQWLSPDGRHIAFRVTPSQGPGDGRLAVRSLEQSDARVLDGTEGVVTAFWSPDSGSLGFFANGQLKRIDLAAGPPQVLSDTPWMFNGFQTGGTWNRDDVIVFGVGGGGLFRVSASGGVPVPVTTIEPPTTEHLHPSFLPDQRHFLYLARSAGPPEVRVSSLDGGPATSLMSSPIRAVYSAGFILFVRDGTLLAQPFDASEIRTTGDPVVVAQEVVNNVGGATAGFSSSANGVLSFVAGSGAAGMVMSRLVWVDRGGKQLGVVGPEEDVAALELSPDGRRLAVSVLDTSRRSRDIWIYDLGRDGVRTRFTFDGGDDWTSAWSPDGRRLAFSATRSGDLDVMIRAGDGSSAEERVMRDEGNEYVTDWSPDGRFILYNSGAGRSQTGADVWLLPVDGAPKPQPLLQTTFDENQARFSPDGRWVAYQSSESGRPEIYVTRSDGSGKWQISGAGGVSARWRRDGRELFFVSSDDFLTSVDVNGTGTAFQIGNMRKLFGVRLRRAAYFSRFTGGAANLGAGRSYDVTPDGQRFIVNVVPDDATSPPITVITNWTATLR